ncbi:MAG: GTPase [Planctomycetota bacterium]
MNPETFVCQLTPQIPSGIATLAIRGPKATEIITSMFQFPVPSGKRQQLAEMRVYYATWSAASDSTGEEQVVICRSSELQVEVHCHGGKAICEALLQAMVDRGANRISAQDWPSDLAADLCVQAERALQEAPTDLAASVLLDQFNGALDGVLEKLVSSLEGAAASHSAADQEPILREIDLLLAAGEFGQHLCRGWRIVLAGPPNVGKSSLINALVGQEKLIVHDQPGTTRDWTESGAVIGGWPVQLTDTAGIRQSEDEIETAGVNKAKELVHSSDLLVLVVDATQGWQPIHDELASVDVRRLVCWNKMDQAQMEAIAGGRDLPTTLASCVGQPGIQEVLSSIEEQLFADAPSPGNAVPFNAEQLSGLALARTLVESGDYWKARDCIVGLRGQG